MNLRSHVILVVLLASRALGFADPPPGYYDTALGLSGPALKAALHDIIDDHTVIPYSSSGFDTQQALEVLDQDPSNTNNVILIYSRRSEPRANWPEWNREHLWPNSYGLDDQHPAYSDLHNLRAANANVNSSRGNEHFDWSDTDSPDYAYPAHPEALLCSSDEDSWEPPYKVKGDIARALFYMAVRYSGDTGNEPDLELTNEPDAINSTNVLMGRLNTLLDWNQLDPPDGSELLRNKKVFELYQGNRNPFVDHPEWVEASIIAQLTIEVTGNTIRLRWEDFGPSMQLQTSTSFPPKRQPLTNAPSLDAQGWYVDLALGGTLRFYRLSLQQGGRQA